MRAALGCARRRYCAGVRSAAVLRWGALGGGAFSMTKRAALWFAWRWCVQLVKTCNAVPSNVRGAGVPGGGTLSLQQGNAYSAAECAAAGTRLLPPPAAGHPRGGPRCGRTGGHYQQQQQQQQQRQQQQQQQQQRQQRQQQQRYPPSPLE
eukprot:gene19944-biopygen2537